MEKIKKYLIENKEFILSVIDVMTEKHLIAYLRGRLNLIESLLMEIKKYENKKL